MVSEKQKRLESSNRSAGDASQLSRADRETIHRTQRELTFSSSSCFNEQENDSPVLSRSIYNKSALETENLPQIHHINTGELVRFVLISMPSVLLILQYRRSTTLLQNLNI